MLESMILRPMTMDDLDSFENLANTAQHGMTNLPKDRSALAARIRASLEKRTHLFALEALNTEKMIGCCGIIPRVGVDQPAFNYEIRTLHKESETVHRTVDTRLLQLVKIHDGPTEIGSLYLHPDYRQKGIGRFLSLSRFLFMAMQPDRFQPTVIAEMRGLSDEHGKSPFWEAVGKHFFHMDFRKADLMTGIDKTFISDLLPDTPILVDLLPKAAQKVIGLTHDNTLPALKLLQSEGFTLTNQIDIFDGGPKLEASTAKIRTIRDAHHAKVGGFYAAQAEDPIALVGTGKNGQFRACASAVVRLNNGELAVSREARRIGLEKGTLVVFSPLYGDTALPKRSLTWLQKASILSPVNG